MHTYFIDINNKRFNDGDDVLLNLLTPQGKFLTLRGTVTDTREDSGDVFNRVAVIVPESISLQEMVVQDVFLLRVPEVIAQKEEEGRI